MYHASHGVNMLLLKPTPLFFALLLPALFLQEPAVAQTREFVFDHAPFASAHASTIVELRTGAFLVAWFGGTAEGNPDVAIWTASRSRLGWSEPSESIREPQVPTWNPVLFYAKTGRLWLYYKFGPSFTWWTAGRRFSDDDGKTWSRIEHLPAGLLGPIRAKPLMLSNGVLLSGTSVESYGSWAAWVERSVDDGKTWSTAGPITLPELQSAPQLPLRAAGSTTQPTGLIQPVLIQLSDRHIRLYARSSLDIGHICIADSADGGVTWSSARPLDLPNPNSGIDLVKLHDGRIVLVYNDTTHGRTPLNLAVSNNGEHFRNFAALETEPGEFSYPALIQGSDGDLHITYTWNRRRIAYIAFPLTKIPS